MSAPRCKEHGALQRHEATTPEQRFCGRWWLCQRCPYTVLDMSPALKSWLADQRRPS